VPPQIDDVGERATFAAMADRTAEVYHALRASLAGRGAPVEPADYALTNAHRRRVALTMNLRELYHFSRLREDRHAQWAIREVASDLSALVGEVAPITAMLVGGKDRFSDIYRSAMGCEPPS
jgi:thymidylate synthase (FAD)